MARWTSCPEIGFLGQSLRRAHGNTEVLTAVADEADKAEVTVLGDDLFLKLSAGAHAWQCALK